MKRLFLPQCVVFFLLVAVPTLHAQAVRDNFGTEFYLGYGPNEGGEPRGNERRNNFPLFITSKVVAHGKVEVPALGFFRTFTTTPGAITKIDLPNGNGGTSSVENTSDETVVQGMSIHVTSDSAVAVFGLNHKLYSSDAFMGLPLTVLGTEYRTLNYVSSFYGNSADLPGEFWIVSPFDSTNVTITLNAPSSLGTPPNVPFNVRMNKGDMYLVEGAHDQQNDLTGSHIESDYPIAVFSGHRRTQIPFDAVDRDGIASRDHLVEQLPPVSAWGDSAYIVPYATSALPDLVRIVAAEDYTSVCVNGVPIGRTLNAGDFYEITQLTTVTAVQASRPIMVGQYMHTSAGSLGDPSFPAYGDPALALVFPVEQFTTAYTIVSIPDPSSFTGNFVNIVVESDGVNGLTIDGQQIPPSEFLPIPNTRYVYAQHQLEQGTHNLAGPKPFGITIYALGPVDSYSYPGGSLLKTITPLKTVDQVIDFGDRVLATLSDRFDTTVYLQNTSQDIVKIFGFPRRIQDTAKFHVVNPAFDANTSEVDIAPGASQNITIEFAPGELNRRMHTQLTARTDHLRAYVVDVYGRGVSDEMGLFRDDAKTAVIDTLDFGVFDPADAAVTDTFYIGNAGTSPLNVSGIALSGTDMSYFTPQTPVELLLPKTLPFAIPIAPAPPAAVPVTFTPGGANGPRIASIDVTSSSGSRHTVILKARIEKIVKLSTQSSIAFDTTTVCLNHDYSLVVNNPNDIDVNLLDATIGGVNAGDFVVASALPLIVPAKGSATLKLTFLPTGRGVRRATANLTFNLPKNQAPTVISLTGFADKHTLAFAGGTHVTAIVQDTFFVPIYASNDLTPYGGIGYTLHVKYDTTILQLLDAFTASTLASNGTITLLGSPLDTVVFTPLNDQPITGGGPNDLPLVYLKFVSHVTGADLQTFTKTVDINYDIDLTSPAIPASCSDFVFNAGTVDLLSICSTPHLMPQTANGSPTSMMLEQSAPNPFSYTTAMQYDIAAPVHVTIAVYDAAGNLMRTIVDADKTPGYYSADLSGTGLPSGTYMVRMEAGDYRRIRRIVLSK